MGAATIPEQTSFQVVRTYPCEQMLVQEKSDFTLLSRYAFLGGVNGQIHKIDLLAKEPNSILRLIQSGGSNIEKNCEVLSVIEICNNGKDELTFFAASRGRRKESGKKNNPQSESSSNIRVSKLVVGPCRHKSVGTSSHDQEESKAAPNNKTQQ